MTRRKINEKVEKIIQNALVNDRFSLYMFDCVKDIIFDPNRPAEQVEYIYDILKFWDENSHIPYETGESGRLSKEDPDKFYRVGGMTLSIEKYDNI